MQDLKQGTEVTIETREPRFKHRAHKTKIFDLRMTTIYPDSRNDQLLLITCYSFVNIEASGPFDTLPLLRKFIELSVNVLALFLCGT
jgi:hypothetical protein